MSPRPAQLAPHCHIASQLGQHSGGHNTQEHTQRRPAGAHLHHALLHCVARHKTRTGGVDFTATCTARLPTGPAQQAPTCTMRSSTVLRATKRNTSTPRSCGTAQRSVRCAGWKARWSKVRGSRRTRQPCQEAQPNAISAPCYPCWHCCCSCCQPVLVRTCPSRCARA